jgi:hypothetical protein
VNRSIILKWILLIAGLFVIAVLISSETAVAQPDTIPTPEILSIAAPENSEIIIVAETTDFPSSPIAAPEITMQLNAVQTAQFQINYINAAATWDLYPEAKQAFEYAVGIWSMLVSSSTPIVIDAYWENLSKINPNILGSAGTTTVSINNGNFPFFNTWYPASLAHTLAGSDLNGSTAEIKARFNSERSDWYFGTDLSTPLNQYNFATVVLHEIGHGLGFFGSMNVNEGMGSWGISSGSNVYPVIYDRFTENGYGMPLINYGNPSIELGTQLTSNYLFFDGPKTRQANGGGTTPIYAPGIWNKGSSYAHLNETYNGTVNALMTYALANGETNYNPGPVALAVLDDIGWNVTPLAVELEQLPSQLLLKNTSLNDAFDVLDYTTPGTYGSTGLIFSMPESGTPNAGITLASTMVDINPESDWTGKTTATIQVVDQLDDISSSTFTVVVADHIYDSYLPLILR